MEFANDAERRECNQGTVRWVLCAVLAWLVVGGVQEMWRLHAQTKAEPTAGAASGNSSPAMLPREVELEMELQVAKDERDQILNRYEALQLQAQQLSAIVDQFLGQMQGPRIEQGNESRKQVEQKLIKALGGDASKGDAWDWKQKALVKKDGTVVPVPKPETKP